MTRMMRRALAAFPAFVFAATAAFPAAAPSPRPRPPRTEVEWQMAEIARDIAEMIAFAKTGAAPPAGFAVALLDGPTAASLSVSVTPAAGAPPIVEPLVCPDFAASPEVYVPLAKKLLLASALTRRGTETSAAAAFLDRLTDFQAEVMAKENVRISGWLDREPLNPEAHEEAAFLAGVLALREQAGEFADPREAILRASAHLALAGALRAGTAPGATGFFARELVRAALGDQEGSRRAVRARVAAGTPSPGEKAWTNAVEIHATGSWKILAQPLTATLVERVMHFGALAEAVDDTVAVAFIQKRNTEPVTDWGRAVLARDPSVGVGNAFTAQALPTEVMEVAAVVRVEKPERLAGAVPEAGLAPLLKAEPSRTLETRDGKAHLRAIPWCTWSRYFQRHLMHAALIAHRHLARSLALSEEAREMRARIEPVFAGLELAPLLREPMLHAIGYEEIEKTKKTPWDRDAGAMFAARSFVQAHPHLVTVFHWQSIGDPPGWVGEPGEYRRTDWFAFEEGPFDITRSIFARRLAGALTETQLQRLAGRRPYDRHVLGTVAKKRHGETLPLAVFDSTYAALLEYDLILMMQRADLLRDSFVEYRRQMEKVVALNPCAASPLIDASITRGTDDETAELIRRFAAECDDTVAVSNVVAFLIDYDLEKGRVEEAGKLARAMADVGSGAGLAAMADYLEARGKIDEAAEYHHQLQERYQRHALAAAFYARHRTRSDGYAAQAAALEKKIFPRGLERVTLADLKTQPATGVVFHGPYWPATWGLDENAIIAAVDGIRTHTVDQYRYARMATPGKLLRLIVWDGHRWREVSAELRRKLLGGDLVDYVAPRDVDGERVASQVADCEAGGPTAAAACLAAGTAYLGGNHGVPRDQAKAAAFLKKACDAGDNQGCDSYARTPQGQADPRFTLARLTKNCAAPTGATSCWELAGRYEWGQGVPQDLKKAEQLYRRACDGGAGMACGDLSTWYRNGSNGVPKDVGQAVALLRKACDLPFGGGACGTLGEMHETGELVPRNEAKAVAYFHKACEGNSALGCARIAERYETGRGVVRDEKRAAGYWDKMCQELDPEACRRLSAMYASGRGVARDPAAAAALTAKASEIDRGGCQRGDLQACERIKAPAAAK